MTEARNDIQIFLSRACRASPDRTLIPAVALENTDERRQNHKEAPLPWAIMVENIQKQDAHTLLHYQFWLSKKIAFTAHPPDTSITKWVGNYLFYATKDQECEVLLALQNTLANKTTVI